MRKSATKIKTAPVAGALKAYVDRVNRLEDDAEAVRDAAKDLTTEIKSAGYNAKAIKRYVKEGRKKRDEQTEADLELYRALLGEPGATYRSVSDKVKVPRSTLHRLVPRTKNGTTPAHDPETGELKEDARQEEVERSGGIEPVVIGLEDRSSAIEPAPQPEHHSTDARQVSSETAGHAGLAQVGCRLEGTRSLSVSSGPATIPGRPDEPDHRIEADHPAVVDAVAASSPRVASDEMPERPAFLDARQRVNA